MHLFPYQVVQRINSIYCTKRGKKRLKNLSLSNIETASLRGKDFYHDVTSQNVPQLYMFRPKNVASWPLDIKQPLFSVCRWQQREWKWLWWQVQRWGISTYGWVGNVFELSAAQRLCPLSKQHHMTLWYVTSKCQNWAKMYILLLYLYFKYTVILFSNVLN